MSLIDNYIKRIYLVYTNILDLLNARGYDEVDSTHIDEFLNERIKRFIEDDGDSVYIDICVNNGIKKTFVKFEDKLDIKSKNLYELKNSISLENDMSETDEIIIVCLDNAFNNKDISEINEFEENNPGTRVMGYKYLMFNITKHFLVPKHTKYNGRKIDLCEKLLINNTNKLPVILHSDPISRYYDFKYNDVIEIKRPVKANKISKVYRICKYRK
jgi:DNA-directed RNA polymerase subunit H (RpoH/RPB5)